MIAMAGRRVKKFLKSKTAKVATGVGLTFAAGFGTGAAVKMHRNWVAKEKVQANKAATAFQQSKSVRNPLVFGKICGIYNWAPSSPKVSLIESVSKKTGIAPANVAYTIAKNPVSGNWSASLDARVSSVNTQIKSLEQKTLSLKGKQNLGKRKHFEAEIKRLKARAGQVKRVKKVIGLSVSESQRLTESIKSDSIGNYERLRKLMKGKYP